MNSPTRFPQSASNGCFFLAAMLLLFGADPSRADIAGPRGIYVLSSGRDNANTTIDERLASIRDYDFVKGYTLRVHWEDVDLGNGVYDFDVIDQALAQLQTNQYATRLNFELLLLSPPQHLVANATETWEHFKAGTIPVPWDPVAQQGYADLISALASHPVFDVASGTHVPFAEHPTLNSLNASIPGISSIRDNGGNSGVTKLVDLPSYSRTTFADAVLQSVAVNRNAFTNKFGFVGYFNMKDNENSNFGGETLNDTLLGALLTDFNNPGQPHVGFFQELLSDIGPNPAGSLGGNLLAVENDTYIMFQALSAWLAPFNPNHVNKVTSKNPATGIELGFSNYGATFFELYIPDIDGAQTGAVDAAGTPLIDDLRAWHDFLESLASDFDSDGDIDAGDLSLWQSTFGHDTNGTDFLAWQRHFGHLAPSHPVQSTTIPEPGTAVLFAFGLVDWLAFGCRRSSERRLTVLQSA